MDTTQIKLYVFTYTKVTHTPEGVVKQPNQAISFDKLYEARFWRMDHASEHEDVVGPYIATDEAFS